MPLILTDVVVFWICGILHWFWPQTPRLLQESPTELTEPLPPVAKLSSYVPSLLIRLPAAERNFVADHELAKQRNICWEYYYYLDVEELLEMPIDIMVLVFENLHPIDLLNLTRANKALHTWIFSPAFAASWRGAYRNHPDIPKSPDGFSPYKWTYLLFGPTTCFRCDSGGLEVEVDFIFRARLCNTCLLKITAALDQAGLPPGIPVPRTYQKIGYSIPHIMHNSPRVSRAQVFQLKQEKLDRKSGVVSEKDYLDNLKLKSQQAREIERYAYKCNDWVRRVCDNRRKLQTATRDELYQRELTIVKRKLVEKTLVSYKRTTPVSTWQNYPPLHGPRPGGRTYYGQDPPIYDPDDWRAWPALRDIVYDEQFQYPDDFRDALEKIPALAAEEAERWKISVEREIFTLCANPNLAISVFVFPADQTPRDPDTQKVIPKHKRRVFIGLSEVMGAWNSGALNRDEFDDHWEVDKRSQDAVKSLALLVGLDPETLLPQEFDQISEDYRFGCLNCSMYSRRGREARCWRDSVYHFANSDPATHPTPHWGMVTPESLSLVKERESWRHIRAWSCNHCTIHLPNYQFHKKVIRHIRIVHKIAQPVTGVDYIRLLTKESSSIEGKISQRSLDGSILYACSFCTDVLSLEDLKAHRKEKHVFNRHDYGEDWQHFAWTSVCTLHI
ncbi:hypothetical protein C8J56DRAFT_1019259 [Mycena floridula]|nr:hypothetical protein C8J56DRAFT_1019259 [Mycena floridula]